MGPRQGVRASVRENSTSDQTTLADVGHRDIHLDRFTRLTAQIYVVPLDEKGFLVYAPLRRAAFVANAAFVNYLAGLRQESKEPQNAGESSAREFLRALEILDSEPEREPVTVLDGPPEPTSVTLLLTTACNLRCSYCYASAGDTPALFMPQQIAERSIDFIVENALRKKTGSIQVNYHGGGEPSVHWKVLANSFDYARKQCDRHGLALDASTATNGNLSDAQIDWIIANLNGMSVSFDGLPSVQDKFRPTVLGQASSGRVMHALHRLDAADFSYGIRMTVPSEGIDVLADSVQFIFSNFKPQVVQVEPAYQLGRWRSAPSAETQAFIAAFRLARIRAQAHGGDLTYSGARVGTLTNHFCGVGRDSFSVSPDGGVTACFEVFSEDNPLADHFFYGRVDSRNVEFDLARLRKLRNTGVESREYCRGCYARWSCAGDCYHKNLNVCGEPFQGTERCHITRELTKDQLLEKIASSGGLYWHESGAGSGFKSQMGEFE